MQNLSFCNLHSVWGMVFKTLKKIFFKIFFEFCQFLTANTTSWTLKGLKRHLKFALTLCWRKLSYFFYITKFCSEIKLVNSRTDGKSDCPDKIKLGRIITEDPFLQVFATKRSIVYLQK